MILSMTGYGRSTIKKDNLIILCEIRSLNGRSTELRIKSSIPFGDKELAIRKTILNSAIRGKIDAIISFEGEMPSTSNVFNASLIKSYYSQLLPILDELGAAETDILSSILRMPNILQSQNSHVNEDIAQMVNEAVSESLLKLNKFRASEGESIMADLVNSVSIITERLKEIDPFDEGRIDHLRSRLHQKLNEYMQSEKVDQNRFEQEVLFYLEKLDINEEKVRLRQHCEHFLEVLEQSGDEKGKKLSFISQEMGREINTVGAKAQWTPIQKHVVYMKNELEKIKEQLANTL